MTPERLQEIRCHASGHHYKHYLSGTSVTPSEVVEIIDELERRRADASKVEALIAAADELAKAAAEVWRCLNLPVYEKAAMPHLGAGCLVSMNQRSDAYRKLREGASEAPAMQDCDKAGGHMFVGSAGDCPEHPTPLPQEDGGHAVAETCTATVPRDCCMGNCSNVHREPCNATPAYATPEGPRCGAHGGKAL